YCTGCFFFFQAEDGIRDRTVTGVQTCALPIWRTVMGLSRFEGRGSTRFNRAAGVLAEDNQRAANQRVAVRARKAERLFIKPFHEIGRASCRERVKISEGSGSVKTKTKESED